MRPPRPPRRPRALRLGRLDFRVRFGFAAVCTLLVVIGARLVELQGLDHANYAGAAAAQRVYTVDLHAMRGQILDRNGTPLAYTTEAQDITADPTQILTDALSTQAQKRALIAKQLSPLVGVPSTTLVTLLSKPGKYIVLAKAVPALRAQQIDELALPGIYTQATSVRQYPGGTTAANVVGLVHSDGSGARGIEYQYNSFLSGKDGKVTYAIDNSGNTNPSGPNQRTPARNGGTVRLTIDNDLQWYVQRAADAAMAASGANGVQVAVLDATTAQVLALGSNGTFNPADPSTIDQSAPEDAPIQSVFEPGSVQKVVTFSAAVQEGLIKPSTVSVVPDALQTGGVTVHDDWTHLPTPYTATGILAQSSNVGTLQIADKLGPTTWMQYEQKFGVGQATGIELPGESAGLLKPQSQWSGSTFANLPIGQGEAVTILQLASMYQTIANNGVRIPPRIVASTTDASGHTQTTAQPSGVEVVNPQTAKTVRTMLESVTLPGGTGTKAAIAGYRVAGKTGTAQKPDPARGGAYSTTMNWDTFAGMAPADNPRFVIAIMVDNPHNGLHGGDVAAPLFHQIASYELQHAAIPPSGSQSVHVPLMTCTETVRDTYGSSVC